MDHNGFLPFGQEHRPTVDRRSVWHGSALPFSKKGEKTTNIVALALCRCLVAAVEGKLHVSNSSLCITVVGMQLKPHRLCHELFHPRGCEAHEQCLIQHHGPCLHVLHLERVSSEGANIMSISFEGEATNKQKIPSSNRARAL